MRITIASTLVALVLVSTASQTGAAAAGPASGQAVRFLTTVVRQLAANDYTDAWQTLHPIDQALVPLDVYVACESASPVAGRLVSIHTQSVGRERTPLSPVGPVVSTYVVRFALVIAGPGMPTSAHVAVRAHAIFARGRWRWMLPPARLSTYQNCTSHS